jgi:hypothetical protein
MSQVEASTEATTCISTLETGSLQKQEFNLTQGCFKYDPFIVSTLGCCAGGVYFLLNGSINRYL